MFGFTIKKSFCDDWDNLLTVVVVNLISMILGLLLLMSCSALVNAIKNIEESIIISVIITIVMLFLASFILSVINMAFGELAAEIANFNGVRLVDFFKTIPSVLKDALLFSLLTTTIITLSIICFEFYFVRMQNIISFLGGALIFWMDVILFLSLQWFIPIRSLMHNNFKKCLKKSMIIFFDNTGFSILMAIHNIILLVLSVFLVGLFPFFAGITIAKVNGLRLRLYKYDYLEEHPELQTKAERRDIPWEELIFDDRETLGPRKLRSFLFPWKDQ